jgi:hypothetical protein
MIILQSAVICRSNRLRALKVAGFAWSVHVARFALIVHVAGFALGKRGGVCFG